MRLNPQSDRLLDNVLPNLDPTSEIGMVVFGLLHQLEVQNNIYQEAAVAYQRLVSDAQELRSEVEEYRQLTDRLGNLNDQLSADNINLSQDNSKLRGENLRLLDENYELRKKIAPTREGEGSQ